MGGFYFISEISFSISISFILIIIPTVINAVDDKLTTLFNNHFWKPSINNYVTLNVLSEFTIDDRQSVCAEFNKGVAMLSFDFIYLVRLHQNSDPLSVSDLPLIPTFQCVSNRLGKSVFYVTYSPEPNGCLFFKLDEINCAEDNIVSVEVTDFTLSPIQANKLQDLETTKMNRFTSELYQIFAKDYLASFLKKHDEWEAICQALSSNAALPKEPTENSIIVEPNVIIHENYKAVPIPMLPCHNKQLQNVFHFGVYTDGIFFKIETDSINGAKAKFELASIQYIRDRV